MHKDGRFLITKRVMAKAWAPGWWEVSGGAVPGRRRLKGRCFAWGERGNRAWREGLGGGYLFSYKRENPGEGDNYFVDIYRFRADFDVADINIQKEETDDYMLATVEEIEAFAAQGIFLHYDSIKQVFYES